jgi:TolA-binding protein
MVATKWLLLGALGGSAVTAAVMIRARSGRTDAPPAVIVEKARVPAQVAAPANAPSLGIGPATPLAAPTAQPRHAGRSRAQFARQDAGGPRASASTLAAEVSRIDAARTANAGGDYDEAIWLIDRYHRDFPDGALAPDAEVVALEAVAAKRDRPETARRAALFLSRYPDDPHAARVKWLTEHRGVSQQ